MPPKRVTRAESMKGKETKPESKEKEAKPESKEKEAKPESKQKDKKEKSPSPQPEPQVKAKKYKKKTYQEMQRIERSANERILLIEAVKGEDEWNFRVQGQSGSQYSTRISNVINCTCPDFRFKHKPCKHLYFAVTQIAQNRELCDYFRHDNTITPNAFKILDKQLTNRLRQRLQKNLTSAKDAAQIDLKDDTDCSICFCQMDKVQEPLSDCNTCKKYFHAGCLKAWADRNPSCPLCRGKLTAGNQDPMGNASIKI